MTAKIHSLLRTVIPAYDRWHKNPAHSRVHWAILGTTTLGLGAKILIIVLSGSIGSSMVAHAASQTWTSQSDWNSWTKSQTSSTILPGSIVLDGPVSSGTATQTFTPQAGQYNAWTGAVINKTTPAGTTLTVDYSSDNSTWVSAITSVPSSESLYIRASFTTSDTSKTATLDDIQVQYTPLAFSSIFPNGGEVIGFQNTGDTTTITWLGNSVAGVDHIHLQYSTNSGSGWSDITGATHLSAAASSYAWDMPDIASSTIRVKAILENASNTSLASIASGADFTIAYNPAFIVDTTSPTLTVVSSLSNNPVSSVGKVGNVVTTTLTTSEPLLAQPTVTMGGKSMTYSSLVGSTYTYTRTLDGTEGNGSVSIAVDADDLIGNHGTGSGSFTTDFTAPAAPVVSVPSTTAYTNGSSSTVSGTAEANSLVSLYTDPNHDGNPSDGTLVTSQQLSGGGTSYSLSPSLATGSNYFVLTATDAAGNVSTPAAAPTIIKDVTNPVVSISVPSSSGTYSTNQSSLLVSGTASDNTLLSSVTSSVAGSVTGTTAWSQTVSLSSGPNTITYTAHDAAGNTSTASIVITLDNTAPSAPVVTIPATSVLTSLSTVTVGGTAEANSLIKVYTDSNNDGLLVGETVVATQQLTGGSSSFSLSVPVAANQVNHFLVTATDAATNQSNPSTVPAITQDSVAPVITISTPSASGTYVTTGATVTVSGTASDGSGISSVTSSKAGSVTGTTSWSQSAVALSEGANTITYTAHDAAGNTSTASIIVTKDTTGPSMSGFVVTTSNGTDSGKATKDDTVTFRFTSNEPLSGQPTVTIGDNNKPLTYVSSDGLTYVYSRVIDNTEGEGTDTLRISSSDSLGNSGVDTSQKVTLDFTAPVITNLKVAATQTGATITWTTSEPATTKLESGLTTAYGSSTAETDTAPKVTSHSVTLKSLTCATAYYIQATSRDQVGLSAQDTTSFNTSACPSLAASTPTPTPSPTPAATSTATPSATPSATPTPAPVAVEVKDLHIYAAANSATVTYAPLPKGYQAAIYRSETAESRGDRVDTNTTNFYLDKTVIPGITYFYTVLAEKIDSSYVSSPVSGSVTIDRTHALGVIISTRRLGNPLDPAEVITVRPGEQVQLYATVFDEEGKIVPDAPLTWALKEASSGEISASGLLTGGEKGDYLGDIVVTTQVGDLRGSSNTDLFVDPKGNITSVIAIYPSTITLKPGATQQYTFVGFNQNGSTFDPLKEGYKATWKADGGTISASGLYTAGQNQATYERAVTLTMTRPGDQRMAYGRVTISNEDPRLDMVSLSSSISIAAKGSGRYGTAPYDQFNNAIKGYTARFSTSIPSVGSIDSTGTFFTSTEFGCYDLTTRVDYLKSGAATGFYNRGSLQIGVAKPPVPTTNISFYSPLTWTFHPDELYGYRAIATDEYGKVIPHTVVTYSMLDSKAGSITDSGIFTAASNGGIYAAALKVSAVNTDTGEVKRSVNYNLYIFGQAVSMAPSDQSGIAHAAAIDFSQEPVPSRVVTGSIKTVPYSGSYTSTAVYNQFGIGYYGWTATRYLLTAGGGNVLPAGLVETGEAGTFARTIQGNVRNNYGTLSSLEKDSGTITVDGKATPWWQSGACASPSSPAGSGGGGNSGGTTGGGSGTTPTIVISSQGEILYTVPPESTVLPGSIADLMLKEKSGEKSAFERLISAASNGAAAALIIIATLIPALLSALISELLNGGSSGSFLQRLLFFWKPRRNKWWGKVVNAKTGLPIQGAQIGLIPQALQQTIYRTVTDPRGAYSFLIAKAAEYRLAVTALGYSSYTGDVELVEPVPSHERVVNLNEDGSHYRINGIAKIRRLRNIQAALRKASPYLFGFGFALSVYDVVAYRDLLSYILLGIYIVIIIGELLLRRAAWLGGEVVNPTGGLVGDAVVRAFKVTDGNEQILATSTLSNKDGSYRLQVAAGRYIVSASKAGYATYATQLIELKRGPHPDANLQIEETSYFGNTIGD